MIRSIVRVSPEITGKEEVIILPLFKGKRALAGAAKKLDVLCRSALSEALSEGRFKADAKETLLFRLSLPKAPQHVLMLGLGKKDNLDAEQTSNSAGSAARLLMKHRFKTAHLLAGTGLVDDEPDGFLHAFVKGFALAQYSFSIKAKNERSASIRKLSIMSDNRRSLSTTIRRARIVTNTIMRVRDLVNRPANSLTPSKLAEEARDIAKENGIQFKSLGPRELEKLGMGAVMDVAKGSREEPRLVIMHYNKGKSALPKVCLVGKGVTFDSGGISIKPWNNMNEMKGDMAGGAVTMGAMAAASQLRLPLEIIGLVPCVENLPDGVAFKPGDLVTTYTGKTIEIISTDAEGRLILSDALAYGCEFEPDVIVDFATLTGAVVIALGTRIAGAMGNSQEHIDRLVAAGNISGEPVWQLPLDRHFSEMVKGDISDYKNYSGRDGSTITAAALLAEFVGNTPWVHLDIAGTFWSTGNGPSYHTKGATGYGVDLALRFLEGMAA